tara:strand:- start:648 stop:1475 length:828 start_codon:yes stop_codon:yes gene_type:complete
MKLRHNKKRNTAFLYESMIKELTKAVINKKDHRKAIIVSIIRESFKTKTILGQELSLYKVLNETSGVDLYTAERLVHEAREDYVRLDQEEIFEAQTRLINRINKELSGKVYNNFVPNYRNLATISQIFNGESAVKERVIMERKLIGTLTASPTRVVESKNMPHMDGLVYKTYINKFNSKYKSELLKEQRELLNYFLMAFSDNGLGLKVFLNEEIPRLKESMSDVLKIEEISSDSDMRDKTKSILKKLDGYKTMMIDDRMVEEVLKIQRLAAEASD